MLRYLGVAEVDIDDLSQEVLLGAYTSLPRYDPHYPAGAYGTPFPPPSSSSPLHDLVVAAVPIPSAAAAVAAAAAADSADPAYDPADPASPPRQSPPTSSSRSRPSSLSPRWRSESAWLFGIAWRKVRSHLERAYRRREVPVGLADAACFEGAGVAPSSEQRVVRKERIALAIRLLASIAPERRAVLLMADAYEIPMREVARALEINENTAASRLRLAREDYRAAVKRLRAEEQHALRSGLLMLPLFSLASASSAAPSRPVLAGASAIAEANAPATLPSPRSDPGRHDPADRPRNPAHSARFARVAHLARPLARFVRPALARGTAAIVGAAVVVAALAPAPVSWADRLAPIATQLLASRAVHVGARPEIDPGEPPRSKAPPRDALAAIPAKETSAARTPSPAPADGSGHLTPAAPRQHASSERRQDPLTEEILLLDAVRQALLQGDRATAMERIAAHERRFPQGRLKLMRERLRSKMGPAQPAPAGNPTQPAPAGNPTQPAPAGNPTQPSPAGSASREMLP
ncbi:RNA polymerase subunit sigma [Sorangium cellulosum]|uniref:RNA polymerase subunit sigma n=1 Tax=Sorangium cellulosum TaxID=56 RepID=A0A150U226_SORCE|nr:RNA polymerase subunit sigma [Sorangium cellulosum]